MKNTLLLLSLLFCFVAHAQNSSSRKETTKNDQMDDADKQLLRRDACRKPIEALETKYDTVDKKDLKKLKDNCQY